MISPPAGSSATYRSKYHWVVSRSVGFGSATCFVIRGFMCSVMRLITPPLPAASRPSNTTAIRDFVSQTHSSIWISCSWRRASSRS